MTLINRIFSAFFLFFLAFPYAKSDRIKIGGLFDGESEEAELVFKYAAKIMNNQRDKEEDGFIHALTRRIDFGSEFDASSKLCKLMSKGIMGLLHGPLSDDAAVHVRNICDAKEMPLLETRFDLDTEQPVINLHPHPSALATLYSDLVDAWGWDGFTIVYENSGWLPLLNELLQKYDNKGFTVTVRQLDLIGNENYRPQLRRVKLSDDKNIIIACSADSLPEVLKQAQQVGLLTDEHQFIITSLDMHTIDLEPFQHSGANITAARLISPDDSFVKEITETFAEMYKKTLKKRKAEQEENEENGEENDGGGGGGEEEEEDGEKKDDDDGDDEYDDDDEEQEEDENDEDQNDDNTNGNEDEEGEGDGEKEEEPEEEEDEILEGLTADKMRLDTALTFDAVLLFSEIVKFSGGVRSKSIDCSSDAEQRQHGISDIMAMKTVDKRRVKGLTGQIHFDEKGHRTNFVAEIIELASDGIQKVGVWNSSDSELYLARANLGAASLGVELSLRNKSFVVLTAISAPYGMLKEASTAMTGNDRFEGFGIELIDKLSQKLGFNYTFILQEDGAYGSLNRETGEWNGMLREIMDGRADLAITDLTITSERESATDFTMPFMNLGISLLFEKPKKEPPQLFSFLSPFSGEVWIYVIGALFFVSFSLFVMGRLSPAEWDNPYPCIEEPEVLENQFSFRNSVWFSIGALLQQGSEIAPKAPSTRIAASMWWFFTLIMVSSYTANLAAFLTIESLSSPISNVEDLANADGAIPYGAKKGGSTFGFFKESDNPIYSKMYEYMNSHPEHMTSSNDEGLERAKAGRYAFLMESSSIEYIIERHCEVTQVGGELDAKGYGIAMKKNSPYRGELSEAVLQMQESGEISVMKIKWWKEKRGGGACDDAGGESGAEELDVANVGGCFLVLIAGSFFALFVALYENIKDIRRRANELEIPFLEEFINEVKFIIRCRGNTKAVRQKASKSHEGSMEIESHSPSPSVCSQERELTYGFRPSLKNLRKLDLMADHVEIIGGDDDKQKV